MLLSAKKLYERSVFMGAGGIHKGPDTGPGLSCQDARLTQYLPLAGVFYTPRMRGEGGKVVTPLPPFQSERAMDTQWLEDF